MSSLIVATSAAIVEPSRPEFGIENLAGGPDGSGSSAPRTRASVLGYRPDRFETMLQPGIDGLAFECEDSEDALVDAV
jgi:hypothetical protein